MFTNENPNSKSSSAANSRSNNSCLTHSQTVLPKSNDFDKNQSVEAMRRLSQIQIEYQKQKTNFTYKASPTSRFYENSPILRNLSKKSNGFSKNNEIKSKSYKLESPSCEEDHCHRTQQCTSYLQQVQQRVGIVVEDDMDEAKI